MPHDRPRRHLFHRGIIILKFQNAVKGIERAYLRVARIVRDPHDHTEEGIDVVHLPQTDQHIIEEALIAENGHADVFAWRIPRIPL